MSLIDREILACLPDLRAYARSLTRDRDAADDLVQEAVLRMLSSANRYQHGTHFRAWAFTILRNRFLNDFATRQRQQRHAGEDALGRVAVAAQQEEGLEVVDLRRIFHELPEEHRSILALVAGSGLPYEEVAKVLSCAVGTVKSRVHRARGALVRLILAQHMAMQPVPVRFSAAKRAAPVRRRTDPAA
ncbi:sigma-70 family RNA polymerase sigma factor [Teichococcus oryzae]|uniref:Sigma-70 family RNA polymerase sigma factor n=1 Tax=Teichococcus oryzae TaxID=1608942 RepID=A0A5B2TK53_9PROT|nr:sigma-70 family RNA polymerase sigma factor [Pseudoroseomonas oryzae]KAA2214887.1 sigma-70 family RNA polymerase sigma factor [Pseudoroseomonas oryzae]